MDALDDEDLPGLRPRAGQRQRPGQVHGREEDDVDVRVRKSSYKSCYVDYHVRYIYHLPSTISQCMIYTISIHTTC